LAAALLGIWAPAQATAQGSDEPTMEEPDPTRLDVERLPPEAIEVTRDLYHHGLYVEGWIGGRGFQGGVGRLSDPGLLANVGVGLEVFSWLLLRVAVEGSIHGTDAPAPPSPTVFELLGVLAEARLQVNWSARFATWVGAEGGILIAMGDVLPTYGLSDSDSIGLMYGGSLGIDWHMLNRHTSMGVLGGARLYPTLDGFDGEKAIGIHSGAYLRYVF